MARHITESDFLITSIAEYGNSLPDTVTAVGSSEAEIVVATNCTLSDDLTIPLNATLRISRGAQISINSGKTLTIQGEVIASKSHIFTGDGDVRFGSGEVGGTFEVYPEWWGAKADGSTSSAAAINKAIDSFGSGTSGGTIKLSNGTYMIETPVQIRKYVKIIGSSWRWTILKLEDGINDNVVELASAVDFQWELQNFTIHGNKDNNTSGHGIFLDTTYSALIQGINIIYCYDYGLYMDSCNQVIVRNSIIQYNGQSISEGGGIYLTGCQLCDITTSAIQFNEHHEYFMGHTANNSVNNITGCWFETSASCNVDDMVVFSGDNFSISNCRFKATDINGYSIHVLAGANHGLVLNNTSSNNPNHILRLERSSQGNICMGNIGGNPSTVDEGTNYFLDGYSTEFRTKGRIAHEFHWFQPDDWTPEVSSGNFFHTSNVNPSGILITQFDNGADGQILHIMGKSDSNKTTILNGTPFLLSDDMEFGFYDTLTLVRDPPTNNWIEIARSKYNEGYYSHSQDIEIVPSGKGLIMRSDDGTRYRLQVENDGTLKTTAV